MDGADEDEFGVVEVQSVPGFEEVVDALAFDESPGEDRTEEWRRRGCG